jgi:hypothetical protein
MAVIYAPTETLTMGLTTGDLDSGSSARLQALADALRGLSADERAKLADLLNELGDEDG